MSEAVLSRVPRVLDGLDDEAVGAGDARAASESETTAAPEVLRARGIGHSFGATPVLRGVDLTVRRGQVVGLVGPNGSGKTTLLRTLYGGLAPDSGSVLIDGRPVSGIRARELARRVAVVVQEPPGELMLSVADTVLLGRTPHLGLFSRTSRRDETLAAEALSKVGLLHLAERGFGELSGGEKQRVLIARALAQEAECLLLDEPTNHLDVSYQHEVLRLVRELGVTAVVVLHDLNLAARYCDRIAVLSGGEVAASGTPAEVLTTGVINPVYGIDAEPVDAADGTAQLLFRLAR